MSGNGNTITAFMRPVVTVHDNETLYSVLSRMVAERRNSLLVVNQEGELVGAVNAVDIIKEVLPDYLEEDQIAARFADASLLKEDAIRVKDKPVSEFMTTDLATIEKDGSLIEAAVLATKHGRGRIAVIDKNRFPIGILTRTEIKKVIAGFLNIPLSDS